MKTKSQKYCEYCDPYRVTTAHILERLINAFPFYTLERIFELFDSLLQTRFPSFHNLLHRTLTEKFFKLLIFGHLLRETEINSNDEDLHSRSIIIVRAAKSRGLEIKALRIFGRYSTNFFTSTIKGGKMIFEGLPPLEISYVPVIDFDDKSTLKQVLKNNGMPFADGGAFNDEWSALRYAKELGFPLVVKPKSGSLSKHTTCNISNENALREAIRVARVISREFILEKFIPGNVYRITVVNNKMIACCLREPPNVIGDGIHTTEELINIKNADPRRGETHQKNFTLHKININEQTLSFLKHSNLTLKNVPAKGEKIYLHNKVVLAGGADIHDKTNDVHPDNKTLFTKLANLLQAPLVGLDFICQDISKPHNKQECAIIETNSLPYIDMHHFPTSGSPQDVADYIVDYFLLGKKA